MRTYHYWVARGTVGVVVRAKNQTEAKEVGLRLLGAKPYHRYDDVLVRKASPVQIDRHRTMMEKA